MEKRNVTEGRVGACYGTEGSSPHPPPVLKSLLWFTASTSISWRLRSHLLPQFLLTLMSKSLKLGLYCLLPFHPRVSLPTCLNPSHSNAGFTWWQSLIYSCLALAIPNTDWSFAQTVSYSLLLLSCPVTTTITCVYWTQFCIHYYIS